MHGPLQGSLNPVEYRMNLSESEARTRLGSMSQKRSGDGRVVAKTDCASLRRGITNSVLFRNSGMCDSIEHAGFSRIIVLQREMNACI